MFIGHFAMGFAAKKVTAMASLGTLLMAAQLIDLPLLPGEGIKVGLGLWHSVIGTVVVEGALFAVGVFLYARATRPRNRVGRFSLIGLVTFLVVAYVASVLGPPPPSVNAVAYGGLAMWLLVAWGYWVDRNRMPLA